MSDYSNRVRSNVAEYFKPVQMPGGYTQKTDEILKTIDLYYDSKYKTGKKDQHGMRKFFYNIVKPACDVASKFIDLDTKDVVLIPKSRSDEKKVWILRKQLMQFMEDTDFGQLLDEITVALPKYGHVVVKKHQSGYDMVPIENLRLDPSAEWMEDSDFVYEVDTRSRGWIEDFVDEDFDLEELPDQSKYLVYECYEKDGDKYKRKFVTNVWNKEQNGQVIETAESQINSDAYRPGIILKEDEVDELPYREVKWESKPGRWLGHGFVEYLEDNQIATNEAENLERKGLLFKTLQLWQTADESIGGENALSGLINGTILHTESPITPVQKDNADLSAINNTRNRWDQNTTTKTFTTDIARGENLPSRTPLGVANAQLAQVASYYDLKRKAYGMFIRNLIRNDIIEDFKNNTHKYTTLTLMGDDDEIDYIESAIIEAKISKFKSDYANETGFYPSRVLVEDQKLQLREQLNQTKNRYLKIPDGFYENAKFDVQVTVVGENIDVGQKSSTAQMALQILSNNPGILQNKTMLRAFTKLLSMGGISPQELGIDPNNVDPTPVQQGGSVSPQQGAPQANNQLTL